MWLGTGFIVLGLLIIVAGFFGFNGPGRGASTAHGVAAAFYMFTVLACGAVSLLIGFMVRWAGHKRAVSQDKDINTPALLTACLGVISIPIALWQWMGLVPYSIRRSVRCIEKSSTAAADGFTTVVNCINWTEAAWAYTLPVITIVVGGFALKKAGRINNVGLWPARFGLTAGVVIVLIFVVYTAVQTARVI